MIKFTMCTTAGGGGTCTTSIDVSELHGCGMYITRSSGCMCGVEVFVADYTLSHYILS